MVGCKKLPTKKPIPTIDVIQMAMNPILDRSNKFIVTNEKTSDNKNDSETVMPMDWRKRSSVGSFFMSTTNHLVPLFFTYSPEN